MLTSLFLHVDLLNLISGVSAIGVLSHNLNDSICGMKISGVSSSMNVSNNNVCNSSSRSSLFGADSYDCDDSTNSRFFAEDFDEFVCSARSDSSTLNSPYFNFIFPIFAMCAKGNLSHLLSLPIMSSPEINDSYDVSIPNLAIRRIVHSFLVEISYCENKTIIDASISIIPASSILEFLSTFQNMSSNFRSCSLNFIERIFSNHDIRVEINNGNELEPITIAIAAHANPMRSSEDFVSTLLSVLRKPAQVKKI
jgi:hypothetical protein